MTVTFTLDLTLELEPEDSAEVLRRDIEKSIAREWLRTDCPQESIVSRVKSIEVSHNAGS